MPAPRLTDDGATVTLDLHGARVEEAERLALAVVREAARRGRDRVRLIHGTSTSAHTHRNRTIKHALYDLLDAGRFPTGLTVVRREGELLLGLPYAARRDPARLHLHTVR